MGILEKIKAIEEEMGKTQKNKATEYHLGQLKAKLAKFRTQLLEPPKSGAGGAGTGFEVGRFGNARIALVGFPSVGKSSILSKLTGAESEVAGYEFTTLTCIPGIIEYNGVKIQLLDLPGIIDGASQGKGRGRQIISTAKSSDLIMIVLDATKTDNQKQRLEHELEAVGIRLNQEPPNITITRTSGGGCRFTNTIPLTHLDDKLVENILKEYRIHNADVVVRDDCTVDQLIDILEGNRKYCKCLYVYNKIDMLSVAEVDRIARQAHSVVISCNADFNMDGLLERLWTELSLVRVYTKKKGQFPDFGDPLILTPQRGTKECTVENAVQMLHRDLMKEFRNGIVWGTSAKNSPATVGIKHQLHDEDVIQIMKLTQAERARANYGKKTGTTTAGTGQKIEKKSDKPKSGPKS
eukprot:GEMP01038804.1.p1 GENE.GEMP01038804.1~~GEMP01038804.1.p1  ORF type:complete len:409 (+),score=79.44 GEMP01038804.1:117-1343(+)